jgi:hypothetical protein
VVDRPGTGASLWIRFLSGPDIDALGLTGAEIVDAAEAAVLAHGEGRVVSEPRVHLVPGDGRAGHFNVLRGHLPGLGAGGLSGVKVVGDERILLWHRLSGRQPAISPRLSGPGKE